MKIATNIFTIYMLALSLVPCSDGGGGIIEIAKNLFEIEQQDYSDHEQHSNTCGDDLCSPFCICSCCTSTVDYPVKLSFQIKSLPSIPGTTPSFVSNIIPSSLYSVIWQPPKLS